jgi:N6-L-threonylcarbamoyladenine synthase
VQVSRLQIFAHPLGGGTRPSEKDGCGHATNRDCLNIPAVVAAALQSCNVFGGEQRQSAMGNSVTILGLESSCDDTAAAVLRQDGDAPARILSSVVFDQAQLHAAYGGVVPEIAARAHAEKLDICAAQALDEAGVSLDRIDAVAVTAGPGLIGGVLSGVMCARGIATGAGLPLIGVNHLAGHALTPRLTDQLRYPYLMLLVSGGHCQFLIVRGVSDFLRLGGTIDDAPGEAFDKTARLLGLPQPGGPAVDDAARAGDPGRFAFPRPLLNKPGCDMSFSGLKTALLRARDRIVAEKSGLTLRDRADLCAGFQAAVADVLAEKSRRAIGIYLNEAPSDPVIAVAGGVAANRSIRTALEQVAHDNGCRFVAPPLRLCTDNAAMIAYCALEQYREGHRGEPEVVARSRWPLDQHSAPILGSGRKGAKA